VPLETALLEREAETDRLHAALRRGAGGDGALVVVHGSAGIGKTRLLATAGRSARASDSTLLRARAGEMEQSFAFGVVRQLFEPELARAPADERARLLDGAAHLAAQLFDPAHVGEDGAGGSMYPLLHGLFWLTANIAAERPVVVLVDDAQWCDEPSLLFLEFLARRVADLAVTVIVATRPVHPDAAPSLARLVADPSSETLHPAQLSHAATAALLEQRLGQPSDDAFTAACRETTGGNPFLIDELSRVLASERIPPTADMATRAAQLGPTAVADSVMVRIARLPGARELVDAVAVLGDGASTTDAALLAGLDEREAESIARALREQSLLAEGRLRFAHPVLRTAVYERRAEADREAAHVAAARLLANAGRPAEHVASQLLHAPKPLGAWALGPLREAAAGALAVGDVPTAQRYARRALLEDLDAHEEAAMLAALGHAQMLSMDAGAEATLSRVLAHPDDPELAMWAALDLGVMLLFSGRVNDCASVLLETEASLAARAPALARRVGSALLGAGQISFAVADRLRPRLDALEPPTGPARTAAERAVLMALGTRGAIEGAPVEVVREHLRCALAPGIPADPRDVLSSPMGAIAPLIMTESFEEFDALSAAILDGARHAGSAFGVAALLSLRSWAGVRRGDLLGAETDARESLDLIRAVRFQSFHTGLAQASLLSCALETGADIGELQAVLDTPAPDPDIAPNGILILARARALAARGDTETALASLLAAGESVYADVSPAFIPWRSTAAVLMTGLGRAAEGLALARDEVERARACGVPGALGEALRVLAGLAAPDEALDLLHEAANVVASSGARLEHARAQVVLGAAMRREGQRAPSREPLRAGHDTAVLLGARRLAATARGELAASGVRLASKGLTGAQALTPSERRVAGMAADGMRNREIAQSLFVTEKTVETHLSRSYDKLNIRSRGALARALAA
jgi:DNA-binding CsgD family transcriptional regulator